MEFWLAGFDKYKGGLDTVHDLTGLYSIYTHWRTIEIMFHVSMLLPYEKHDPQKVRSIILIDDVKIIGMRNWGTKCQQLNFIEIETRDNSCKMNLKEQDFY